MATQTEKTCQFTPADFRKILRYDPETGLFYWLRDVRCGKNMRLFRKAGDLAGCVKRDSGYLIITVDYQHFYGHRLAWFMTYGVWPSDKLDHIDVDRGNNRMVNLREATERENRSNTKMRAKAGLKGVVRPKHSPNSFIGQITINGKNHYLGCFRTPEEAHAAYCSAATEAFGEFARFS